MSKLDSLGMIHRLDGYGADRHAGCALTPRRRCSCRTADVATGRVVRYSSLCCPTRRHLAGCPSGQRERSVKPSAKPTQVRTLDLPHQPNTPSSAETPRGAVAFLSGCVRPKPAVYGWPRRICGEVSSALLALLVLAEGIPRSASNLERGISRTAHKDNRSGCSG